MDILSALGHFINVHFIYKPYIYKPCLPLLSEHLNRMRNVLFVSRKCKTIFYFNWYVFENITSLYVPYTYSNYVYCQQSMMKHSSLEANLVFSNIFDSHI